MHFSNSLSYADFKTSNLCDLCKRHIVYLFLNIQLWSIYYFTTAELGRFLHFDVSPFYNFIKIHSCMDIIFSALKASLWCDFLVPDR